MVWFSFTQRREDRVYPRIGGEKMKSFKLIHTYKRISITAKATIWYTLCNMLQKLAAFLIIPFLTRMLSVSDYGLYSVFLSWTDIFEIFATMRIYSNGYVAGLVKNADDQDKYTCSIQFTSIVITVICLLLFSLFSNQISHIININTIYIYYMFLSFFATSSIGIWSSRQRVNNKYKLLVMVTLFYSVFAPITSIIGAYLAVDKLNVVILVRVVAQFIISVPFAAMNLFGPKKQIIIKYCKESLSYNIPLVPYYLSMVVLNSSDRIMISKIVGDAEAGIYSVAYSLSMAVFVFVGALNLSLQPWIFNKLKEGNANGADKVMSYATCFIAFLNICVLIVAPELIRIVASEKYADAMWTMPPIICSLLVIFIYQQVLNIHFYYGENKIIFIASIVAAGLNLTLNYIFITAFGYIAASYTTLISYLLILVLYIITMKRIAKKNNINYCEYFNLPLMIGVLVVQEIVAVLIMILYPYTIIRYLFILSIAILAILFRKRFLFLQKDWSNMENS